MFGFQKIVFLILPKGDTFPKRCHLLRFHLTFYITCLKSTWETTFRPNLCPF